MIHGTHGAYFNGGCRCPACKEAAHRYYVEVARPRREGERIEPKGEAHPLVAYAASLSKMVYTIGGRTRVFAFPPMGELRRDDDRG